jgi:hypothetical protein
MVFAAFLICECAIVFWVFSGKSRSSALSETPFSFSNHPAFPTGGLINFTSNLPVIVLETVWPGPVSKTKSYSSFQMKIYESKGGMTRLSDVPVMTVPVGLHVRGMLSRQFPKLSYRLKLRDEKGTTAEQELLGMPRGADWVLHGPWLDKSLIRNAFSYDLARAMNVSAVRTRPCELFLSTSGNPVTEADYMGVYQLIEDVQRGKHRVNLAKLAPDQNSEPEITGGYLLEWDVGEGNYLPSWKSIQLKYPSHPSPEQRGWIDREITQFDRALKGTDFDDPVKGYAAHIDAQAWVDFVLFEEFIFNLDAYTRSFYMHKDRGGKIRPGPVWDHDLSVGHQFQNGTSFDVWWYTRVSSPWFSRLAEAPNFRKQMAQRWSTLRKDVLSDAEVDKRIDAFGAPLLAGAAERNFTRWGTLDKARPLPRPVDYITIKSDSYPEQVDALKRFLHDRGAWMDKALRL